MEHGFPTLTYTRLVDLSLFDSFVGVLMIGYYMKKYIISYKTNKKLVASIITFVICTIFNVLMTRREYDLMGAPNYLFYDNRVYLPIVLASVSFFYMVSYLKVEGRFAKVMKGFGSCSFGIYLLSDFFISRLYRMRNAMCAKGIYPFVAIIIYEFIILLSLSRLLLF